MQEASKAHRITNAPRNCAITWRRSQHMQERVTVRKVDLQDVETGVDRSRSITDLQQRAGDENAAACASNALTSHTFRAWKPWRRWWSSNARCRKNPITGNSKSVRSPGIDDFASMGEVVGRRYRRLLAEGKPATAGPHSHRRWQRPAIRRGRRDSKGVRRGAGLGTGFRGASRRRWRRLAKREEELFLAAPGRSVCVCRSTHRRRSWFSTCAMKRTASPSPFTACAACKLLSRDTPTSIERLTRLLPTHRKSPVRIESSAIFVDIRVMSPQNIGLTGFTSSNIKQLLLPVLDNGHTYFLGLRGLDASGGNKAFPSRTVL